jgi:CBS domain-containing protein
MTPDPHVVTPKELVSRAARIMRDHDVGMVPVVTDTTGMVLVGVITDRDIAVRHVAEGHVEDCVVADHMTSDDLETIKDTADPESVLAAMRRREIRRVGVVDRDGRLVGVIAQADVAIADGIPKEDIAETVKAIQSRPTLVELRGDYARRAGAGPGRASAQRAHRIEPGSPAGGQVAGGERRHGDESEYQKISRAVGWRNAEQQAPHQSRQCGGPRHAERQSG